MKKLLLISIFIIGGIVSASAQLLPSFQFGVKGGVNMSGLSTTPSTAFSSQNRAGYLVGFWARLGGAGINFQPELYYTSKNATLHQQSTSVTTSAGGTTTTTTTSTTYKARFQSVDLPLLIGTKFGILGNGLRINTGPVISFAVNKERSIKDDANDVLDLNLKGQNYAWQFGLGADIRRVSVDLRYEAGINKVSNDDNDKTRINLFNLTLAYRLFSL